MPETIVITDLAGSTVFDPEDGAFYATGLNWESMWPKGFGQCSFTIRRKHPWASWAIRESYGVKVYDGAYIAYEGRIETIRKTLSGSEAQITCVGWYVIFEERLVFKRWVDQLAVEHLRWPAGLGTDRLQNSFVAQSRDNSMHVMMGTRDIDRLAGDKYRVLYSLPAGTVRRILADYAMRAGEGIRLIFYDYIHVESFTYSAGGVRVEGSAVVSFTNPPQAFEIHVWAVSSDLYDQNDYATISGMVVEANYETGHPDIAAPGYTQDELIIDLVLLLRQQGQQLSADFARITGPTLQLYPYGMDRPTKAGQIVEDILNYGDSSLRTWGVSVWDSRGTSDNLPRVETSYYNTDDYDYLIQLDDRELRELQDERLSSELYNHVTVGYTDEQGIFQTVTPDDDATLKDTASIARDYQRGYYLELKQCTEAQAIYLGRRFLEYHSMRKFGGSFTVVGEIETAGGGMVPVNRARAGCRVKLANTGEIFFIRHSRYDAEAQTVTLSPEAPSDNLDMWFAQQERERKYNAAPEGTF